MSVLTTAQRLADMYALIPGITQAFWYVPRVLQSASLPAVVIEPGDANYETDPVGDHTVMTTTLYRATLFYDRALFGTETQSETGLLPLIDSIRDYFLQRPGLELSSEALPQAVVYNAKILRSGGYRKLSYPVGADQEADFATVTFFHQVMELSQIENQY